MEPHERHVQALVNQLNTIRNEKASYFVVWIYALL
jgi:hypothetical protein